MEAEFENGCSLTEVGWGRGALLHTVPPFMPLAHIHGPGDIFNLLNSCYGML